MLKPKWCRPVGRFSRQSLPTQPPWLKNTMVCPLQVTLQAARTKGRRRRCRATRVHMRRISYRSRRKVAWMTWSASTNRSFHHHLLVSKKEKIWTESNPTYKLIPYSSPSRRNPLASLFHKGIVSKIKSTKPTKIKHLRTHKLEAGRANTAIIQQMPAMSHLKIRMSIKQALTI